jgi:hypothetical protein
MATHSRARNGQRLGNIHREEKKGDEERATGFNRHAGGRVARIGVVDDVSRQRAADGKRRGVN